MSRAQPPVLAVRLMQDADTDPVVIGDLIETYAGGRTRWWFWKQAMAAALPSRLGILRWLIAFPLAFEAGRFASRLALHIVWSLTGGPAAFNTTPMRWSFMVSALAMTVTFISVATLVVPHRKPLVAKTLLAIVCAAAAFAMYLGGASA